MARETHCDRVARVLSDGLPHTHHELYARTFTIVHSRVSDLRKRGWDIRQWREGDAYIYQFVGFTGSVGKDPSGGPSPFPPAAPATHTRPTPPVGDEPGPSFPTEQPAMARLF